jgi:hypothetical protein
MSRGAVSCCYSMQLTQRLDRHSLWVLGRSSGEGISAREEGEGRWMRRREGPLREEDEGEGRQG